LQSCIASVDTPIDVLRRILDLLVRRKSGLRSSKPCFVWRGSLQVCLSFTIFAIHFSSRNNRVKKTTKENFGFYLFLIGCFVSNCPSII
jgi:hypothetical protein